MNDEKKMMIAGAVAALAVLLLIVKKKGIPGVAADVGAGLAEAVVSFGDGIVSGGAYAIGDRLGVPRTDLSKCEQAKAEGRTLDASFACPAGSFLSYLFN